MYLMIHVHDVIENKSLHVLSILDLWCLQGMPTFIKNVFKVCQLVKFNRCLYSKRLYLFSNLLISTR